MMIKSRVFIIFILILTSASFFLLAKKVKLDPESEDFYKYARYLFTKNERKIFLNLANKEDRKLFIKNFWEIRDPTPETTENEFKIEMEERFKYVTKFFREGVTPGWKTDRGRIYILLGPPDIQDRTFPRDFRAQIIWHYDAFNLRGNYIVVVFYDKDGDGVFRMDPVRTSLDLLYEVGKIRHFLPANKKSVTDIKLLDINLLYDTSNNEILLIIDPNNVQFEESGSQMMAKFKINFLIDSVKNNFSKYSAEKTVYITKESLLKKDSKLEIRIPQKLPKGKTTIEAIIKDLLGNAIKRKTFKLKIKGKK